jgi:adenine-specific DNA-methyltransferase
MLKVYKTVSRVLSRVDDVSAHDTIFHGDALRLATNLPANSIDLIFSSPPYCMGKEYENSSSIEDFSTNHRSLLPELARVLKPGGSICWQVGYHTERGVLTPLDFLAHEIFQKIGGLKLRNRVIWSFAHGLHASKRFSGRHEVILWYTKGDTSGFDLDSVRVPQKYPGKRSYHGPNKGKFSGNPLGKNPGDVWDIPNVKGSHLEKTIHPCQFPVALPLIFVKAVCPDNGLVLDPFMGVGSTGVAAAIEGRRFIGGELIDDYVEVARQRISSARQGKAVYRPMNQPIQEPNPTDAVARKPDHFRG